MYLAIDKEALNKISNYLGKRPYIEVFHIFKALSENGVKPIEEVSNELSKEDKKEDKEG